jgi:GNAT superfamily N-acetyltransferase
MEIREYGAPDLATVTAVLELSNTVGKVDSPWEHPQTLTHALGILRDGWDGTPPRCFAMTDAGRTVAAAQLWTFEWDNPQLAWLWLAVHPDVRRRGHGSALLARLLEEARAMGRTSIGIDGWESEQVKGFAARHGFVLKSQGINRRQHLDELDSGTVEARYAEAAAAASAYELVRIPGRTPDDLLDAVAQMTGAINDAPIDDLDMEDEVFTGERVRGFEEATLNRGCRLYRLLARHRDSGALAGHTVVAVEEERPQLGEQEDTSVVRAHRGHRLGLLLKAGMLRWLAEAEPQLRSIDTWNAESNSHMIEVNELLGYRVMGRGLEFQRDA